MGDDVSVKDCPIVNFQKSELPSTMNIVVKAYVANLTEVKKDKIHVLLQVQQKRFKQQHHLSQNAKTVI